MSESYSHSVNSSSLSQGAHARRQRAAVRWRHVAAPPSRLRLALCTAVVRVPTGDAERSDVAGRSLVVRGPDGRTGRERGVWRSSHVRPRVTTSWRRPRPKRRGPHRNGTPASIRPEAHRRLAPPRQQRHVLIGGITCAILRHLDTRSPHWRDEHGQAAR